MVFTILILLGMEKIARKAATTPNMMTPIIPYHPYATSRSIAKDLEAILNPPDRKTSARKARMKTAMDALGEAGLTPDEIVALAVKAKKRLESNNIVCPPAVITHKTNTY